MAIDLESLAGFPSELQAELAPFERRMRRADFLDDLFEHPVGATVVRELDRICVENGVVGHHFTRASRVSIGRDGLVLRSGAEWRSAFMQDHGERFSVEQRKAIEEAWGGYFTREQTNARNGWIWLTATRVPLVDGGADRLLRYFGGEAVYMPLTRMLPVATILAEIGEPLVVAVAMNASEMRVFDEFPWGKAWLSSYHRTLDPRAHRIDWDLRASRAIGPDEIISIRRAANRGSGRQWHLE